MIGVLCCNEIADRPVQTVASRFLKPLTDISGAAVLLVPAISTACDLQVIADRLDGLLLTGSRSNVAAYRYGAPLRDLSRLDEQRDEVALSLSSRMIENGRPVFGICRGLQELNVLFGGSLREAEYGAHHHPNAGDLAFDQLFDHQHEVALIDGGHLAAGAPAKRILVNSVHEQGIERLGNGLRVEATATDDDMIEGFSARPCGGLVLAVQWHPEWDTSRCTTNRRFFELLGSELRAGQPVAASSGIPAQPHWLACP